MICRAAREIDREEVTAMEPHGARSQVSEWESPDFDEIGCGAEVTMYVAQMQD
jgi:coenzyme PQQ precursor peptide PqqA